MPKPTVRASDPTVRYALLGGAFGATFPMVATLMEIGLYGYPYSVGSALRVQAQEPLLWIIDTAPFVLAAFAGLVGKRQGEVRRLQEGRVAAEVGSSGREASLRRSRSASSIGPTKNA